MNSSTSVENPVNQISALLHPEPEKQEKVETPEPVQQEQSDVPPLEVSDESQQEKLEVETPEEEAQIDTLNNLADELEIPVADMYALNIKLAEGEPVQLGTLKDFYETNKDIETQRQEITQREQDLQVKSDELRDAPQISNELLQARAQVMSIQDQYNRVDWNGLRTSNPSEYAALQQDFRAQFELAKQNEATANQSVETHKAEAARYEQERLFNAMPELKDEKVRAEAGVAVQKLASRYGFTQNDVANIEDSRLMRLLIDFSKSDTARTTAKDKQVDKAPTSASPNAAKPLPNTRKQTLKNLTKRAKETGNRRDQVAAVTALRNS